MSSWKQAGEASKLMRQHCKKDATKPGEQLAALIAEHVRWRPRRRGPIAPATGWRVVAQPAESGHINARRSALRIATGGLLPRTKGSLTVTWERN